MKKLLIICILLIGIVLISLQTSDFLIKTNDLPKGYYSSEYTTYAISQGDSFIIQNYEPSSILHSKNVYEGNIPPGKKRIATTFHVNNEDDSIQMSVGILEFDTNSGLIEYLSNRKSEINKTMEEKYGRFHNASSELKVKEISVGDYSYQTSFISQVYPFVVLEFCIKNYLVVVQIHGEEEDFMKIKNDIYQKEMFKVAETIERKLD